MALVAFHKGPEIRAGVLWFQRLKTKRAPLTLGVLSSHSAWVRGFGQAATYRHDDLILALGAVIELVPAFFVIINAADGALDYARSSGVAISQIEVAETVITTHTGGCKN